MRQDSPRVRKQFSAVTSDGPVGRDVLRLHGVRHIEDAGSCLVRRGACVRGVEASLHRPAEVHGGGSGSGQRGGVIPQLGEEPGHGGGSDAPCGDGHRVGGGNADGRRAPHLHRAYRDDGHVHGADVHPLSARWEFRLIQQNEVLVLPDDGMYLFGGFQGLRCTFPCTPVQGHSRVLMLGATGRCVKRRGLRRMDARTRAVVCLNVRERRALSVAASNIQPRRRCLRRRSALQGGVR